MSIAAIREAPPPRSSRYRSLGKTLIILDDDDDDDDDDVGHWSSMYKSLVETLIILDDDDGGCNSVDDIGDGHDNDHWSSK